MDLNLQYAHHSQQQFDTVTDVSHRQAIKAFDDFAWLAEAEKAQLLQKCLPTLSIIAEHQQKLLWISAYIEGDVLHFNAETKFPAVMSSYFGLCQTQGICDLCNPTFSQGQARKALLLFVSGSLDELEMHFNISH
ncbi:MAG: hypothetical protein OFPI_19440 [Osedax symbiont Rs2]|nr:MAG: hypothetical protein OFPI_19440 [Osedax symbiont Rs2]